MIITNATVITWAAEKPIIFDQDIVIVGNQIVDIGSHFEMVKMYKDEPVFNAKGKILMPGLICAHTHFYGLFSRGMNIPGASPKNFTEILEKLWWPLDSSLEPEDVKISALICMIDAIRHGTTTLFDHHASPMCIEGSLDLIENAFAEAGLRGVVCYETTDRYGAQKRDLSINENLRMMNKIKDRGAKDNLIEATFGIHASLTVSDQTLDQVSKMLPGNAGIHIHVAEDLVDEIDSINKSGVRVVQRLKNFGLLGNNSIIVHGVHLDEEEIAIIKNSGSWVSHQPRSNMNNAVGLPEVEKMINMGIPVCLGNDGFSNAMWDEWRTCYLVYKLRNKDPRSMNGNLITQMGAQNNAELATHYFKNQLIGRILPGYKADLILVDYHPITEINQNNIPWHIIFGFRDSMVTDTMVNGNWLMNNKKLNYLDEIEISKKGLELSKKVWQRYNSKFE